MIEKMIGRRRQGNFGCAIRMGTDEIELMGCDALVSGELCNRHWGVAQRVGVAGFIPCRPDRVLWHGFETFDPIDDGRPEGSSAELTVGD